MQPKPNIEQLLSSDNINNSIIELDNYICALCDWGDDLDALTYPQRVFHFNQELEREVNNGGFEQYFENSSGMYANDTITTLELVGANTTANILRSAIDFFPDKQVPIDQDERVEMVSTMDESVAERWEELDQQFFNYEDNLNSLNMEFVRKHKEDF